MQLQELEKTRKQILSRAWPPLIPWRSMVTTDTLISSQTNPFQTSDFQNCQIINVCCFKPPGLGQFITAAIADKYIKPVLKEVNPEYSLEGLMFKLKLQYFGHLMGRAYSLEKTMMLGKIEGRTRRGRQRMRWMNGITDLVDMSLSKLQQMVEEWEARYAAVCRVTKSQT